MNSQIREAIYILIIIILTIPAMLVLRKIPTEQPNQKPTLVNIIEFDIADYGGELGRLYVVRAEWVYLSTESAEEKREALCK